MEYIDREVTAMTIHGDEAAPRTDPNDPTTFEPEACLSCGVKQALTRDEEIILARMRKIKEEVRRLTERMNEIRAPMDQDHADDMPAEELEEWNGIFAALETLREQWREWRTRLDEAVERKLIALGHREP
jgi:hypothetical protein